MLQRVELILLKALRIQKSGQPLNVVTKPIDAKFVIGADFVGFQQKVDDTISAVHRYAYHWGCGFRYSVVYEADIIETKKIQVRRRYEFQLKYGQRFNDSSKGVRSSLNFQFSPKLQGFEWLKAGFEVRGQSVDVTENN